jgi:hypothetical protein
MDESGTHDGADVTCTGLWFARPAVWRDWTKKWNHKKKPIKVFHSTDCQNFRGEFDGWDAARRDAYVPPLLATIPKHNLVGWVVGFDNRAFAAAKINFPELGEMIESPYELCFQISLMQLFRKLNKFDQNPRAIAIIHENNDCKGALTRCFEWIAGHPDNQNRVLSLTFAEKHEAVPLQAADALAYEGAKRVKNVNGRERRAWRALNPSRGRVQLDIFNQKAIEDWFLSLKAMNALGLIGPIQWRRV